MSFFLETLHFTHGGTQEDLALCWPLQRNSWRWLHGENHSYNHIIMKALKRLNRLRSPSKSEDGPPSSPPPPPSNKSLGVDGDSISNGAAVNATETPAYTMTPRTSSSLRSATEKISQGETPYPMADLPHDRSDPLWNDIRQEYGLTLPELGALKNTVHASEGMNEEIEVSQEGKVDVVQMEQDPIADASEATSAEPNIEPVEESHVVPPPPPVPNASVASPADHQENTNNVQASGVGESNESTGAEDETETETEGDLDDLDNELARMNIDRDFECWSSFRNSITRRSVMKNSGGDEEEKALPTLGSITEATVNEEMAEAEDLEKWGKRLMREEVFSLRYRPSKAEKKELSELEKQLGLRSASSFISALVDSSASANEATWKQLVHPESKKPSSILLKRGPILYKSSSDQEEKEHEAELILLTHGFVIAKVQPHGNSGSQSSGMGTSGAIVSRTFERAFPLTSVVCAGPDSDDECGWEIVVRSKGQEKLHFVSGSVKQQAAWLKAMETTIVNHYMHDQNFHKDLGWQYRLIHKPGFTRAVLGVEDDLIPAETDSLNNLDSYNGYAPLHVSMDVD